MSRVPVPAPNNDGCLTLIDRFIDLVVPDEPKSRRQREELAEGVVTAMSIRATRSGTRLAAEGCTVCLSRVAVFILVFLLMLVMVAQHLRQRKRGLRA